MFCDKAPHGEEGKSGEVRTLPAPQRTGKVSLEDALARRRSIREFGKLPLSDQELAQLLWATQGITHSGGLRAAPSAGALYPLGLYVATPEGFFHYRPQAHHLIRRSERDLRASLARAALDQPMVREAPAIFVIAAVFEPTAQKYGPARTPRYVHLEAGHAAQNLLLQAVALGLGAVPVGAFHDERVQEALGLPADHKPLYLIPVGHPR
jgi:SagB-type dehydrogenase family enzyme